MAPRAIDPANAEEARRWNQEVGRTWVEHQERTDAFLAPLGARALAAAQAAPGEHVLDVGCGAGTTSLALARSVGASGHVLGLDVSSPLLEVARSRAAAGGLTARLELVEGDAQVHDPGAARFDLLFSRFGVMFFADPLAAFRNLARALRPGARLCFVCWQALERNPCFSVALGAVARVVPMPAPPPPGAPGQFAFADPARVTSLLGSAGFSDVAAQPLELDLVFGRDLDEAVALALELGPAAGVVREAGEAARRAVEPELRELFAPQLRPEGVTFVSATWLFTARRS